MAVVGAPSYFARRQRPRTPDDLARHSCVEYRRGADGAVFEWEFERSGKSRKVSVSGRVMVNDPDFVRAAGDGLGIAYTITAQAEPFLRSGQLVRVLEDWSPSFGGLFLYYPSHRQVPAALRALIDMVREAGGSNSVERPSENLFSSALSRAAASLCTKTRKHLGMSDGWTSAFDSGVANGRNRR